MIQKTLVVNECEDKVPSDHKSKPKEKNVECLHTNSKFTLIWSISGADTGVFT